MSAATCSAVRGAFAIFCCPTAQDPATMMSENEPVLARTFSSDEGVPHKMER
jgi:hypothetical protein